MKRNLLLALVLPALVVLAAGCGGGEGGNAAANQESERGGPVGQADSAACAANRSLISSAAQQYQAVEGVYPASIQALVPGYLQSVPACPSHGSYALQDKGVSCSVHGD